MTKEQIKKAIQLLNNSEDLALAVIIEGEGSMPRHGGANMIICQDGSIQGSVGGGALEAAVRKKAAWVISSKSGAILDFNLTAQDSANMGMICGGRGRVRIDYLEAGNPASIEYLNGLSQDCRGKAFVFGAGHCGEKLVPLLGQVGFRTIILDDRMEYANHERFAAADEIVVLDSFTDALQNLPIDEKSYIIILTRGHLHDKTVLQQSLKTKARYIGMIGSRQKREETYRALREEGFTTEDLNRVTSPIGLSIGAETPEEIAVSIAAQLIQVRAVNPKGKYL